MSHHMNRDEVFNQYLVRLSASPTDIVGQVPPPRVTVRDVQASGRTWLIASYLGADLAPVSAALDAPMPEFWIVRNRPEEAPGVACYAFTNTADTGPEITYLWALHGPEAMALTSVDSVCIARASVKRPL